MTPHLKSATLPGRLRIPYVEQGDPAGVPLVLLHGYSDSWRSWEPVLAHLPHTVHAFAITQRGHGDADRPIDGYRWTTYWTPALPPPAARSPHPRSYSGATSPGAPTSTRSPSRSGTHAR